MADICELDKVLENNDDASSGAQSNTPSKGDKLSTMAKAVDRSSELAFQGTQLMAKGIDNVGSSMSAAILSLARQSAAADRELVEQTRKTERMRDDRDRVRRESQQDVCPELIHGHLSRSSTLSEWLDFLEIEDAASREIVFHVLDNLIGIKKLFQLHTLSLTLGDEWKTKLSNMGEWKTLKPVEAACILASCDRIVECVSFV